MYVIAGVTGNTGAFVAEYLLKKRKELPVRVIVRDEMKGQKWKAMGADVAVCNFNDVSSIERALKNADAAYLLNPPTMKDPDPFKSADILTKALSRALANSSLKRLVALSSIGASMAKGSGMIYTTHIFEENLKNLPIPTTFVRACYFMENWIPTILNFQKNKVFASMLQPLTKAIPMISVQDVGHISAKLMIDKWTKNQIVTAMGPKEYSPMDVAQTAAKIFDLPEKAIAIPERDWKSIFLSMGASQRVTEAFIEMVHGFNESKITFQKNDVVMVGEVSLENAIVNAMVDKITV